MCIGILMLQLTFSPLSFIWSTPSGNMSLTRFHFVFQEPGQWRYMVLVMILLQCQFWCSDLCVALFLGDSAKLTIDSWLIDTYLGVSLPLCVVWTIEVSSFFIFHSWHGLIKIIFLLQLPLELSWFVVTLMWMTSSWSCLTLVLLSSFCSDGIQLYAN